MPNISDRKLSAMEYSTRLSEALRVHQLNHATHDILCAVGKLEARNGHATIPGVALCLGCAFQNIYSHVSRNESYYTIEECGGGPRKLRLSSTALRLLGKIKDRTSNHE